MWRNVLRTSQCRPFSSAVVTSPSQSRVPFSTRVVYFSLGLNLTLALGLYQLGQDASHAASALEDKLKEIRDDTASVQKGLRAKIAKLEAELAEVKTSSE